MSASTDDMNVRKSTTMEKNQISLEKTNRTNSMTGDNARKSKIRRKRQGDPSEKIEQQRERVDRDNRRERPDQHNSLTNNSEAEQHQPQKPMNSNGEDEHLIQGKSQDKRKARATPLPPTEHSDDRGKNAKGTTSQGTEAKRTTESQGNTSEQPKPDKARRR